jgi:tetratricopeptide (TPR) repeat protein
MHDLAGASAILASATKDFPDDLALGLHRIDVARKAKDLASAIAEYQRSIEHHPEELELYLELGQLLASEGRLQEARVQWEKTLEGRLTDGSLAMRIAELHSLYGMHEEAARLIERALELEPSDMRIYGELAGELEKCARSAEIPALLDRAADAAGEYPARLEDLAAIARGTGAIDRARAALGRALQSRPDEPRLVYALVELEIAAGEKNSALERLLGLLDRSSDTTVRRDAIARILRLHPDTRSKLELEALLHTRGEIDPSSAAVRLLAAELAALGGSKQAACELLTAWITEHEGDVLALERLADLQAERGQTEEAIATFEKLSDRDPRSGTRWLERMAEVHLAVNQEEEAFACYDEILRRSPDNSATFASVAMTWKKLGEEDRAVRCWEQALRLAPDRADWKLELADLYDEQENGERARELAAEALKSSDPSLRARARTWIYERLVRDDRIEEEIARLREAVARNPYDDALSLTLVDILIREFEYELALELLDDVLRWRPKEELILRERAKLLVEMERWQPAMADYEVLWKLPEVDHSSLARDIAECAIELGDRSLAERYLAQGSDPAGIASFYEHHDFVSEAIEVLERALALAPDDVALLEQLSHVLERSGNVERALQIHERTIALQGESMADSLRKAELELALGDKARACETYAAAILRVPLPAEPDFGDKRAKRRALGRARVAYSGELESIWSALASKNLANELVEIAARVLAERPQDPTLVNRLVGLTNGDRGIRVSVAKILPIVRSAGAASIEKGVAPAGDDAEGWAETLASIEKRLIEQDPKLARERVASLTKEAETAPLTRESIRELMRAYRRQDMQQELEDLFVRAHETFPDDEGYLMGVAQFEMEGARWEEAEAHLALLEANSAPRASRSGALEESERDLDRFEKRLRARLPEDLVARLDAASVRTLYRLNHSSGLSSSWNSGGNPSAAEVRLARAEVLAELGRTEEVRAILATFEPPHEEYVARSAGLAALYARHHMDEDAARLRESVWRVIERVEADPLLRHERSWPEEVRAAVLEVAGAREEEERWTEAYEIVRSWAGSAKARRLLRIHHCRESVEATFAERYATELAALGNDPDPEVLRRWRRDAVHGIELDIDAGDLDAAIAIAKEVLLHCGADPEFEQVLARLYERAGRMSDAIAKWQSVADARRKAGVPAQAGQLPNGAFRSDDTPPDPHALVPEIEVGRGEYSDLVQELSQVGMYYSGGSPNAVTSDAQLDMALAQIVRIGLSTKDYDLAAKALGEIFERSPRGVQMVRWGLLQALQLNGRSWSGGEAQVASTASSMLPIGRLLEKYAGDEEEVVSWYGQLLAAAGDRDEAIRTYKRYLRKFPQSDEGTIATALRGLQGEEARAKAGGSEADLAAAASADPKNAHLRIAHVRELLEEGRYEEACTQALETEAIATHLAEARSLARTALALCSRDEEYETRLVAELERVAETQERYEIAGSIAELRWSRGDEDGARAILEAVAAKGGADEMLDPGAWFLRKGRPEVAREFLEQGLVRASTGNSWYVQLFQSALASLPVAGGRIDAMLARADSWLQGIGAEDWDLDHLQALAEVFEHASDDATTAAALREAIGAREEPDRSLYLAALAMNAGDPRATEEALVTAALADRSTRTLLPEAVGLARDRGDFAAALSLLERVEPTQRLSERMQIAGPVGPINERVAHLVERGALRLALSDREGAEELWREAFPDEARDAAARAAIYMENGLWAEAAAALSLVNERAMRDDPAINSLAAAVAYRGGSAERALELLETAPESDRSSSELDFGDYGPAVKHFDPRHIRLGLLLETGRIDEAFAFLREAVERAPEDYTLGRALVELVGRERGAPGLEALAKDWPGSTEGRDALDTERCRRADEAGNWELVAEVAREALERTNEWERHDWAERLANACVHLDRTVDAGEAIRRSVQDPAGAEAYGAAVDFFVGCDRWDAALDWLEAAVLAKVKLGNETRGQRCRILYELGRDAEAFEALWACIESRRANLDDLPVDTALLLAERTGERARLAEAVQKEPADRGLQRRSLALALAANDWNRAIDLARGLLDWPEGAVFAAGALASALEGAGRSEEALAAYEIELDRLDRAQLFDPEGELEQRIVTARAQRARLAFVLHGEQGFLAVRGDSLGSRFRAGTDAFQLRSLEYGSYQETEELWTLGLWRAYLEQDARAGNRRWNWGDGRRAEARFRAGDVDAALEEIWKLACGSSQDQESYPSRSQDRSDSLTARLFGIYLEADRLGELLQRFESELVSGASRDRTAGTYARVLARLERWEEVARVLSVSENQLERADEQLLARACLALGRFEAGLQAIERASARNASDASSDLTDWREGFFSPPEKGGRTRFAFGNAADSGGTMQFHSGSSFRIVDDEAEREAPAEIALHATLLRANGRADEAPQLEEPILRGSDPELASERAPVVLAKEYAKLRADDDVERLLVAHAARGSQQAAEAYEILAETAYEHEDAARLERYTRLWLEHEEERRPAAEAPERWRRAAWLARVGADRDLVERAVEAAQAFAGTNSYQPSELERAWITLATGDAGAAIPLFRAAADARPHSIERLVPKDFALQGLALALLQAEGPVAARAAVLRALAENPSSSFAPRLRRALFD